MSKEVASGGKRRSTTYDDETPKSYNETESEDQDDDEEDIDLKAYLKKEVFEEAM